MEKGKNKCEWYVWIEGRKLNLDNRFIMTQTTFCTNWNVDALIFLRSQKNVMGQRILNTNEQTENVIETVATWHYRIQLIMQIQWSEAVTWSTTSMEMCFNQHVHWFPSFYYLSHRRAALQLNSWMEIATFIDVDMKSDKMSLWSVSKLWLKASMFCIGINDIKANNYFLYHSHISLWIIYFQSILLSDSWQVKRM